MLSVRPVSPVEPDAQALLDEYFAVRAETFPGTYRPVFPTAADFTAPRGVFLLAQFSSPQTVTRLLGCGGVRQLDGDGSVSRWEIKHLFLRPQERGRGWGHLLLRELENWASEHGATEMVLDTHHTLEAAAALYTRSGYGEIEPYNDNPNATRWYGKPIFKRG